MAALEMDYNTIHDVIDSWEALKRKKDYDVEAGTLLFTHLFEKYPPAKVLFGFPIDMDPNCEILKKSRRFVNHAKYMIAMLDNALGMLGPDAELLAEVLYELGQKHVEIGVKADSFPIMGDALLQALEECLGPEVFDEKTEKSWKRVYEALSGEMVAVIVNHKDDP